MNQKTIIMNGEDLFGGSLKMNEFQNSGDSFETHWEWPDGIGNGFIYGITFRPGFVLGIGDYQLRENLILDFEVKSSAFVHIGLEEKALREAGARGFIAKPYQMKAMLKMFRGIIDDVSSTKER